MTGAGDLRESVTLQAVVEVSDGYGGTTSGWADVATVPARIRYLRGSETVMAARLQGRQPVVITIRHEPDLAVTTDWRALDARAGTAFNIRSIEPDEKRAFIDILAESGVAT